MQSEAQARYSVADEEDAEDGGAANVSVTYGWMPTSGYGPYCTIPISSGIGGTALIDCGLLSFADTRREVLTLAADYANRAMALVEKERRERLQLSLDVRGQAGEVLICPNPLRCKGQCRYGPIGDHPCPWPGLRIGVRGLQIPGPPIADDETLLLQMFHAWRPHKSLSIKGYLV